MSTGCSPKSRATKISRDISSRSMVKDERRKTEDGKRKTDNDKTSTRSQSLSSVLCLLSSVFLCLLSSVLPGCGKKGPPRAPLNLAPEAPATIVARRLGDTVYLQMKVPAKSALGIAPYSIDHIDVYAVTLPPGPMQPANRDLLKKKHVIPTLPVPPP